MPRRYVGNGVWEDVPAKGPSPQESSAAPAEAGDEAASAAPTTTTLVDEAFTDVATRFLTHLPPSELQSADRLFFQIEQAHWFYEDFLADAPAAKLPHFHLRTFAQQLFARCALLKPLVGAYEELFSNFREYKGRIPVCGCILLDKSLTKLVLVRNWAKTSWGLPKGKLNQNELKRDCAAREVLEETGYDAGELNDDDSIELVNDAQHATMFVVADVPVDFPFAPRVRKEISKVAFFPLDALPNDQWNVDKFIPRIRRWIKAKRKARKKGMGQQQNQQQHQGAQPQGSSTHVGPATAPAKLQAAPHAKPPKRAGPTTPAPGDRDALPPPPPPPPPEGGEGGGGPPPGSAAPAPGVVAEPPPARSQRTPRPAIYIPPAVDYAAVQFAPEPFRIDVAAVMDAVDAVLEARRSLGVSSRPRGGPGPPPLPSAASSQ